MLIDVTETSLKERVVRIEIMELVNKPLFRPGSAELLPEGKEILKVLAETIKDLPVLVSVGRSYRCYTFKGQARWETGNYPQQEL